MVEVERLEQARMEVADPAQPNLAVPDLGTSARMAVRGVRGREPGADAGQRQYALEARLEVVEIDLAPRPVPVLAVGRAAGDRRQPAGFARRVAGDGMERAADLEQPHPRLLPGKVAAQRFHQ